jgi:hypothetical protein
MAYGFDVFAAASFTLVRIMAAPSPMRCSASARLVAPQTKSTFKVVFVYDWFHRRSQCWDSSIKSTSSLYYLCFSKTDAALAITRDGAVSMICWIIGSDIRATPRRRAGYQEGMQLQRHRGTHASSAIFACSALVHPWWRRSGHLGETSFHLEIIVGGIVALHCQQVLFIAALGWLIDTTAVSLSRKNTHILETHSFSP